MIFSVAKVGAIPPWIRGELRSARRDGRSFYWPMVSRMRERASLLIIRAASLSISLRYGRDDKGERGAPVEVGCWWREPQIPRLRSPGFPVELGGVGGPHAPFLKRKGHTRLCPVQRGRKSGSG